MTRRAFITGISGFIGQALARALHADQVSVSGISRSGRPVEGCRVSPGEVVHPASYATEVSRAQIVVHLAAPTTQQEITSHPLETMKVNWRGTANLLDCFRAGEGEHFIYLSTGKVYGRTTNLPISEEHPLNPETVLGKTKRAAEDLIRFYAEHTDKRFSIVRLFNAYGPGQKDGFLVPVILDQIDKPAIVLGDIHGRRDFIYIDDVVAAIVTLISNFRNPGGEDPEAKLRIFNVGSGQSQSPADLVAELRSVTGKKLEIKVDETRLRKGEADEERADISKIGQLGWKPQVSIREGLERTWRSRGGA